MHSTGLADQLAQIRIEIARLRRREAALRRAILDAPAEALLGRWSRVEVEHVTLRVFDAALLPVEVRNDPRYWVERHRMAVKTAPLPAHPPRPGWPIRREALH